MNIEMTTSEIWDLLKEGSTNQRDFISSLTYNEFKEFIELIEDYGDFDLRGLINGGVLKVEDDPEDDLTIWRNNRVGITLIWLYTYYL